MKFVVTYTETSKVTRIVEAKTKDEAMDKMQQLIDTHDIEGWDDTDNDMSAKKLTEKKLTEEVNTAISKWV